MSSGTECAQSLQRHNTQYQTEMMDWVCSISSPHTAHIMDVKGGRIYRVRAILWSHKISSKCITKKLRFCFSKLPSQHFNPDRKQASSTEPLLLRWVKTQDFTEATSQVVQCVQSVNKTQVQRSLTREHVARGKSLLLSGSEEDQRVGNAD